MAKFQNFPGVLALLCALAGFIGSVYSASMNLGFWMSALIVVISAPVTLAAAFLTKWVIEETIYPLWKGNFLSKLTIMMLLPAYIYAMFVAASFMFHTEPYKDQILLWIPGHIILGPLVLLISAPMFCFIAQFANLGASDTTRTITDNKFFKHLR
jgi:hypothetical protein